MISMVQPKLWFRHRSVLFDASVLSFAASMIANVANYGTQAILGRLLGPVEYGAYNALMAVLVLLSVPISALVFLITRQVANYNATGQEGLILRLYQRGLLNLFLFGVALVIAVMLWLPFFQNFLHIDNLVAIAWLGPVAMVAPFLPFNMAFSQGLHDFRWVAFSGGMAGPFRFITCVTAAMLGWGLSGTMIATFVACILGWILSTVPLRKYCYFTLSSFSRRNKSVAWRDIIPVFLSTIAFMVLTQCDVIMVKHLFTPHESGLYASASLLGKAVLYVPGAVVVGLVPMVAGQSRAEALTLFKKALLMTAFLSGTGACLLWLMPYWVLHTFFGAAYLPAAELLKYFGLSMLPMAFILIIKAYFIAKSANLYSYVMLLGAAGMMITIFQLAKTPMDVLQWIGIWGSLIALIGLAMEFCVIKRGFSK